MTTTTTETTAQHLARLQAMPHHGLYPITLGSNWDVSNTGHVEVLQALQDLGWTVEWKSRTIALDAEIVCGRMACPIPTRGHRHPHPLAGATFQWGKATPPGYDYAKDPIAEGTARAVERTGNSDGFGRTDFWAPDLGAAERALRMEDRMDRAGL